MLIVVSNREPYLHQWTSDGEIVATRSTGGVAVALDALMHERGGTWIAHGAGDADREVVNDEDRVKVPPEDPAYWLRRIWLSDEEERRYYGGFSNEGLWPLCHLTNVEPVFRPEDWAAYQIVNRRFANAIRSELAETSQPVFIQDYHLALVAGHLRALMPGVRTAIFWHIPWPLPDRLRLCPWRTELVQGLLANDLVAFQVDRDRRNFVAAAREFGGAAIAGAALERDGHMTHVTAVPIGVDYDRINAVAGDSRLRGEMDRLRREFRLTTDIVGIGVDRIDYTKGIPERLAALDRLFASRPDLASRLTFALWDSLAARSSPSG